MEELYLTKLNYLAEALTGVHNKINKYQVHLMKFYRVPQEHLFFAHWYK